MAKWKDITSHSRGETDRTPRAWEIRTGADMRVTVHRYVGCGDALFLTCSMLGIETKDLHAHDPKNAKAEATRIVSERLANMVAAWEAAIK